MKHFSFPTSLEAIKQLVDDANTLHEDQVHLKKLLNAKLKTQARAGASADAPKPPAKSPAKPSSSSSNGASQWEAAPSVAEVASKSAQSGTKIKFKQRPVEPETDSDDDTPLPKKSKLAAAPAKKSKEGGKAGGKAGGKDGKDKPFKGVTAYNVYFGERTTALRKESPEMDRGEVAKMTGVEWKALTPDEKAPWDEKAVERNKVKRAAYDAAKANGTASTLGACIAGNDDDEDEEDE